ncbi:MAG TPA: preprotein translocase subunit SecG [Chloroflexia bacterium]|nr:preprotein translocase subunit SecG [Chloroflexia bacterium]
MTLGTLNIIQIILGVFLIVLILLQSKGNSFSGAMGGDNNSIFRTRRGFELRLFQLTIIFAVVFVLVCLWASFFK